MSFEISFHPNTTGHLFWSTLRDPSIFTLTLLRNGLFHLEKQLKVVHSPGAFFFLCQKFGCVLEGYREKCRKPWGQS